MHKLLTGSLSVETLTIEITGLPEDLQGAKLIQLSDLHYDGIRLSEAMLAEAIALINDHQPDLIVLTGDLITDDPTPIHDLVLRLKHLQSRNGVYAILGNHDYSLPGAQVEVTAALTKADIHVLWNQIAHPLGLGLPVVGLADFWSREFNPKPVMEQLDPATPRIVLSHNPDSAVALQPWRVDIQFSGHTHGGQIVIPGLGPLPAWNRPIRRTIPRSIRRWIPYFRKDCHEVLRHWEWASGLHQVGSNRLYVNRGMGTYLPGRLFCPPEVTVITLMPA